MANQGSAILIFILGCISIASAVETCTDYFLGKPGISALCPNYCCGTCYNRYCCSSYSSSFRGCPLPAVGIIGIVIGGILAILAIIAVVIAVVKCCAAQQAAEDAAMVPPPQPDITVISAPGVGGPAQFQPGPPFQGGPPYYGGQAPYPGPQPPAYGPPGYNQVAPAPNVIVVNQSRPQPAPMIAPPMVAPMPLIMPLPIGGFGDYHHHHHHYGGHIDAPIAIGGNYGGGVDAPIAIGGNYGGGFEASAGVGASTAIDAPISTFD